MKITFWKNNKLNQEYQIELSDILKDFLKASMKQQIIKIGCLKEDLIYF